MGFSIKRPLFTVFLALALNVSGATARADTDASSPPGNVSGQPELVRFDAPWTSPYRVDPERPYHFVNAEGRHLFVMNKTAWAYFGCRNPQACLERARAQGVNVIRVALESQYFGETLGIDLWPWGGTRENPDFETFNEPYWSEVERRIQMAGRMGIGFDIVLYTGVHPRVDAVAVHQPYWRRVIGRLGKYANVFLWEIKNENLTEPDFQDAVGAFFRENDPWGRPVCTSDGTTDDAAWPDKPWVSVAVNHSCTGSGNAGGDNENARDTLDGWYLTVARKIRSYGKPAFCNESGREKRHHNDDGVHRRKQGWIWCAAGAYWSWHSWDGCEGIDEAEYQAPGAQFIEPLTRFFQSLPFYDLEPAVDLLAVSGEGIIHAALANEDRSLVVAYFCAEQTGRRVAKGGLRFNRPAGTYRLTWLNPSDLKIIATRNLKETEYLSLPEFTDDLVLKAERLTVQ